MDFQVQPSQPPEAQLHTGKRSRDWEPHLPKIKRLRYEDGKPVKEIIMILKDEDNFVASEREYKERLAKDVRKNLKKEEKIQIALKQYERLLKYNKQSTFYLGDQLVDMRKIERYIKSNELRVEDIYANMQNISVLLPSSISVCTPPSSPTLEAADTLPYVQLSPDSALAAAREFGKDSENKIEDIMLSLSLEGSAASLASPEHKLPTVSAASNVQFRNFWKRFRSDTKSGSPYACELSLKSQASLQPSLFSVASGGRSHIPSFSTPPLSKVMDEWEQNDPSRTQYPYTKAPSGADSTICPHVTTFGQEHPKAFVGEETASIGLNTELQEDDQGNHFLFEEDEIPQEDEMLKKSELHLQRLVGATSMCGVGDGDPAALMSLHPQDGDAEDVQSWTSPSYVLERRRKAAVQLLKKAKPDFKDEYTLQPLWQAALRGDEALVEQLLEKGAKPDLEDEYGRTPLSLAAARGHEEVVQMLLEKGAKLDSEDKRGRTPLSLAAVRGYKAVVQILLEKGAKLDLKDEYGRTPLSLAAERGHEEVVQILLKKGAKLDSEYKRGQTPLSLATERGYKAVVQILLEKGVKLDLKDEYGRTPLTIGCRARARGSCANTA